MNTTNQRLTTDDVRRFCDSLEKLLAEIVISLEKRENEKETLDETPPDVKYCVWMKDKCIDIWKTGCLKTTICDPTDFTYCPFCGRPVAHN